MATTAEDSNSLVSEDNISNTDDTSYLEHRELTPLLSSDTESVDVFDTTSLPGDPVRTKLRGSADVTHRRVFDLSPSSQRDYPSRSLNNKRHEKQHDL